MISWIGGYNKFLFFEIYFTNKRNNFLDKFDYPENDVLYSFNIVAIENCTNLQFRVYKDICITFRK